MISKKMEQMVANSSATVSYTHLDVYKRQVTDHRIKLTLHKLDTILNGDLDEVIDSLIAADQSAKLANMNE